MDTDGNIWSWLRNVPQKALFVAADATAAEKGIAGLTLLFILFVIGGGFFGGAESAFSAMNKIRIKAKADDGNKRAKGVMYISNNFDRALTTLLIGNNITHIAAASVATVIATRLFDNTDAVALWCTIISTMIVFLFSEMIPKSLANDRCDSLSMLFAAPVRFLMKILTPLVTFFTLISRGFTKLTERFMKHEKAPSITEDELYDIIDTIEKEGVMNEEQGDLFKSALDFSDTRARDVMTMRQDIVAIDASLPNAQIIEQIKNTTHSRLPVYDGDLDHIIGTLQIRAFIRAYLRNPNVRLRGLLIPPYFVKPDALIDDLLTEMRQHKFYLGVVRDAEMHTVGIITIEDFLEELVGEIWDEDDVVDNDFVKLGGNRFQVSTHLICGEVCEKMGIPCPPEINPARPILSLLLEKFDKMPEEDDCVTVGNLEFTVEDVENGKIDHVIIRVIPEDEQTASADDGQEA